MSARLLLIRHAATEAANRQLFVGSTDEAASETALRELIRLEPVLGRFAPQAWLCSPMKRAQQTAAMLDKVMGFARAPAIDDRLREIDFGRWEMKSFAEIASSDPELVNRWASFDDFIFPEGEAVADFQERIGDVYDELVRSEVEEVGVITHGGVIRAIICLALGLEAKNYLMFNIAPGTMTVLDLFPGGAVLSGLNV